ncbi:MAG: anaerobic ribonucleoside-triphosphate reductase activating protein [Ruminococcus sp.]|nr:anaerobic ribonucleoside-triphosphate reductase activating protein [Ruminococcus sp.]
MDIRVSGIENDSIVDGPGIRMTLFVQGCPHRCKGCHNPQTHDFGGGTLMDTDEVTAKILGNPLLDGVTFSGGEPFEQAEALYKIGTAVKSKGLNIMVYSGYTFDELKAKSADNDYVGKLLGITDILVDGRYIDEQRSLMLLFRGSTNQRIIDVQKSLETGVVVEMELEDNSSK